LPEQDYKNVKIDPEQCRYPLLARVDLLFAFGAPEGVAEELCTDIMPLRAWKEQGILQIASENSSPGSRLSW
jgi:hypothetical protein